MQSTSQLDSKTWQVVPEDQYVATPVPLGTEPPGTLVQVGTLTSYYQKSDWRYIFSFSSGWEPKGKPHTMRWSGIRALEQMQHMGIHTTSGFPAEDACENKNKCRTFFKATEEGIKDMLDVADTSVPTHCGPVPFTHINFWAKHKYLHNTLVQSLTCAVAPPPSLDAQPAHVQALWQGLLTPDKSVVKDDIVVAPDPPDIV